MKAPPLLPEETLRRVQRVSHMHGTMVFWVAGFFALTSALAGDYAGTVAGLVVAGAGAVERHGADRLEHGYADGVDWLPASQLVLFAGIAAYCLFRLNRIELPPIPADLRPLFELNARQWGMDLPQYMQFLYLITFRLVLVGSVFYQGGLAFYYLRHRAAVHRSLDREA